MNRGWRTKPARMRLLLGESMTGGIIRGDRGGTVQNKVRNSPMPGAGTGERIASLRADFVARPEAIGGVREGIEKRISAMWGQEGGFLNGLVLVSDQEARLTTLITFWEERALERSLDQKLRHLKKILHPYADRCLSVRTEGAYFLLAAPDGPREEFEGFAVHPECEDLLEETPALCGS